MADGPDVAAFVRGVVGPDPDLVEAEAYAAADNYDTAWPDSAAGVDGGDCAVGPAYAGERSGEEEPDAVVGQAYYVPVEYGELSAAGEADGLVPG